MSTKYPLCEAAGLDVWYASRADLDVINASDVEWYLLSLSNRSPKLPQPAMPWEFKPEDFKGAPFLSYKSMADRANAKLAEWLGAAPLVASFNAPDFKWYVEDATPEKATNYTHTARLICIEPLAKPDTHESLLRELERETRKWFTTGGGGKDLLPLLDRTSKLLGDK